jgi:hypothetical protein
MRDREKRDILEDEEALRRMKHEDQLKLIKLQGKPRFPFSLFGAFMTHHHVTQWL